GPLLTARGVTSSLRPPFARLVPCSCVDCPDEDTIAAFVGGAISTSGYSSIEAHMDRCSSCSALVAEAAKSRSAMLETRATPTSGALSRGALAPSSRLGRYIVLEELGEGGMGRVYAAYDPELDRRIALKLLRPELAARRDPSMGRARLLREAQAMARLSHPNVLTVHDVGEVDPALLESREPRPAPQRSPDDEPLVFIAMEI